jgi:hypothetical protein
MTGLKLRAAIALYRWQLSSGIVSIVFSALAFIGVFAVLFAFPWPALLVMVLAVIFGTGFVLDHGLRFWEAQATVSTTRNQYLIDALYQKEALQLRTVTLPTLRALSFIISKDYPTPVADELTAAITRLERTVAQAKWDIADYERVY